VLTAGNSLTATGSLTTSLATAALRDNQVDLRPQILRAGIETLVLLAFCGIGLVVLGAGAFIIYVLLRPTTAPRDS